MNDAEAQADDIFRAVRDYIDDRIKHADADLNRWASEVHAVYDARIKALEQAPFEFKGTWDSSSVFEKNAIVVHDGSMWIALRKSSGYKPGDGSDAWQLVVKRGRDGRDAR